jgi:hypothetical protein
LREISILAILSRLVRRLGLGRLRELLPLLLYVMTAVARLLGPGGAKALVAENLLIKQQLLIGARGRGQRRWHDEAAVASVRCQDPVMPDQVASRARVVSRSRPR